jgi:hypothetical protein
MVRGENTAKMELLTAITNYLGWPRACLYGTPENASHLNYNPLVFFVPTKMNIDG